MSQTEMKEDQLWRITTPGAVFGMVVHEGTIIATAPYASSWKGKTWAAFARAAGRQHGWELTLVGGEDD